MELEYDPKAAVVALSKADRKMARLIRRVGPFALEVRGMQSPFQTLLRSIVSQQLSGRAAETIYGRVTALFPRRRPEPRRALDLPETDLRGAGMSRAKVAAVRDLAAKTVEGTVPTLRQMKRMTDAEIVSHLTAVRGIGTWTVQMLLLFRLGRPDVLPVDDLGVRKGFMLTYGGDGLPKPGVVREYGARWQPYRSVASWYLWRALELDE